MNRLNKGDNPTKTTPTTKLKRPSDLVGEDLLKKELNKGLKGFGNNLKAWQKE